MISLNYSNAKAIYLICPYLTTLARTLFGSTVNQSLGFVYILCWTIILQTHTLDKNIKFQLFHTEESSSVTNHCYDKQTKNKIGWHVSV